MMDDKTGGTAADDCEPLERHDIQGIIVYGYGNLPATCYLLLQITDAAGAQTWLGEMAGVVSNAVPVPNREDRPPISVNLAFTAAGLRALGLESLPDPSDPSRSVMNTFPDEFRDGMSRRDRARILGDNGQSDPRRWEFGGAIGDDYVPDEVKEPHVLLMLFASDGDLLGDLYRREKSRWEATGGITPLSEENEVALRDAEHFGFRDGITNPVIAGTRDHAERDERPLCAGEFILGYRNEYGTFPFTPVVPADADKTEVLPPVCRHAEGSTAELPPMKDLGRNGSYLVYRKLKQDVAGFWRYCAEQAAGADHVNKQERIAAKMVGRWPGGAPLVLSPNTDDPALGNDAEQSDRFLYAQEDPHGFHCPLGAHVRRANPRDHLVGDPENKEDRQESLVISSRHRILRRGRPYGPPLENARSGQDDGRERGLIFISIVANIARQFEFVQQTWLNNPKFLGLYSDRDPISGDNFDPVTVDRSDSIDIPCRFTIPQKYVRRRLVDVPRFVTVRGGAYFFLPSISAICFLAGVSRPPLIPEQTIPHNALKPGY
jgi:Dyp-type peroxidase family